MEYLLKKIMTPVLFFLTLGLVVCINSYEVKADVGIQSHQEEISVHSTKVKSNKVIKISKKSNKTKTKRLSRGSNSISTNLVQFSYKFLGKPYIWASSGPNSFDCSGFTSYVYSKFGYSLPHYTGCQANMGKTVSRGRLKIGDLVFFNTTSFNGHVGIYIGNGKFIHASSGKRKVVVSSLNDTYYNLRFSKARRIMNSK